MDTTFPSGRNDALQWNIQSKMAGKIPVEIRYFTSGITWAADYVGIANEDETKLNVTGYVRVINSSGELYDNAQTRLVVGNINLVEKIADLARRPPPGLPVPPRPQRPRRRPRWRKRRKGSCFWRRRFASGGSCETRGPEGSREAGPFRILPLHDRRPRGHQGQGTQTAGGPQGGRSAPGMPLQAHRPRRRAGFTKFYRFKNLKLLDEKGKEKKLSAMENLGLSPLPNGMVRLFSEYKNKDLAYVGGTETRYVPIGDRVEVNVGPDKDITIHRRLKDQQTANVVARQYKRRLDDQFVLYYDLIDYDETLFFEEEMVSGKPVVPRWRWNGSSTPTWCSGAPTGNRRAGTPTPRGPTSICTRSPAGSSGGPEPRKVFPGS